MNRPTVHKRRGIALIYTMLIFSVIVGFVSLAVDGGRYQLVGMQLQMAVDAAARYGASGMLIDGQPDAAQARARAVQAAMDNVADGQRIELAQDDIQCLSYKDGQLLNDLDGPSYAVKVTARRTLNLFLGMGSIQIQRTAVAKIDPRVSGYGLVGLDWVKMSGNSDTDSYDAADGVYSPGAAGKQGSVATNGYVTMSGNAYIGGDVLHGVDENVSMSGNAGIWGSTRPLASPLSYPAVVVPTSDCIELGALKLSGNNSLPLPGGVYHCTELSLSGNAKLILSGPVTIYVTGKVSLSGNADVYQDRPGNFQIRVASNQTVTISGNGTLFADVYAPLSDVKLSGNGEFNGALIGRTLTLSGNGGIHCDQSLDHGDSQGGGSVTLVKA